MNILTGFLNTVGRFGPRLAIVEGNGRSITYDALAAESNAIAHAWAQRGMCRGDRVLIAMPLGIGLYLGLAALWRLGAVAVLPEPAMGLAGARHAAQITRPRAFLTAGIYRGLGLVVPEIANIPYVLQPKSNTAATAEILADVDNAAPALISFTSGSTGAPKTIVRSHGFLAAQNAQVRLLLAQDGEPTKDLVAFPVFVVANLALGVTSYLPNWNLRRHDQASADEICAHLAHHQIARALIPPAICETLGHAGRSLPLRAVFTGGGPIFPDILGELAHATPQMDITCVYGSTEAEPIAHIGVKDITAADWASMRAGAGLLAGPPGESTRIWIRNQEILVAGAHVNTGYLDPSQNGAAKVRREDVIWHRTGDAGRIDDAGRIWLLGRHSEQVGGLFPFQIETPARGWPGVRRVAMVASSARPLCVIEGDQQNLPLWRKNAAALGDVDVIGVDALPLDRRHRSKIDYAALKRKLRAR